MAKDGDGDNSFGVASVVLAIIAIVIPLLTLFSFLAPVTGLILGIVSLVFAIIQRKHNENRWAKWGLVLAIIAIVINLALFIAFIMIISSIGRSYQSLCDLAGGCDKIPQYLQSQQAKNIAGSYNAG